MPRESEAAENKDAERPPRAVRRWMAPALAFGALLVALPVVFGLQKKLSRPTRASVLELPALIAFDDVVQKRLSVVPDDNSFGIRRLISEHDFRPVTPAEERVMNQLKSARLDVALYMGGRSAHDRKAHWGTFTEVSPPTFVTGGPLKIWERGHRPYVPAGSSLSTAPRPVPPPSDLPTPDDLRKRVETMLNSNGTMPRRWKSGAWDVVAAPVAASEQACVDCHNRRLEIGDPVEKLRRKERGQALRDFEPLQIGDVAGVAIYAYRRHKAP